MNRRLIIAVIAGTAAVFGALALLAGAGSTPYTYRGMTCEQINSLPVFGHPSFSEIPGNVQRYCAGH